MYLSLLSHFLVHLPSYIDGWKQSLNIMLTETFSDPVKLAWTIFGFISQIMFFMRFFVQWIVSEKKKKSVVPDSFWYLSIIGALLSIVYDIYLSSIPMLLGHVFGLFTYTRNLMLVISENKKKVKAEA